MTYRVWVLSALMALVSTAAPAAAQIAGRTMPSYELNVHAGAFLPDVDGDRETDGLVGTRFVLRFPSGWSFGGNFDWVASDPVSGSIANAADIDINTFLYSGEVSYLFPSPTAVHFFVGAGVGAATTRFDAVPGMNDDPDDTTDLLVPLSGGLILYNRTVEPSWGFRFDARDNIVWVDTPAPADDTEATHNWEFSAGISIPFGN